MPDEDPTIHSSAKPATRVRRAGLSAGTMFADRYEIVGRLGQGGMSTVYKAVDKSSGKTVAVKTLLPHLLRSEDHVKRFEREAQSVGTLKHRNIVAVYSYSICPQGVPYIAMEFLDGESLYDLLKVVERFDYQRAVPILIQIADALDHAHENSVVHRDLKPSNVLLRSVHGEQDVVGILDFGLAKFMPNGSIPETPLTQNGEIFGSPPYMSPEQCQGSTIDQRSDIYSFGCLMYEMLTGRPPLVGDNPVATVMKQLSVLPKPFATSMEIEPRLEQICLNALAKEPAKRQQSMGEIAYQLRGFLAAIEDGDYCPNCDPSLVKNSSFQADSDEGTSAVFDDMMLRGDPGLILAPLTLLPPRTDDAPDLSNTEAASRAGADKSSRSGTTLPALAVLGSVISLCVGSSYGKSIFPYLGAEGVTAYRIGISAVLLLAVWRPWRIKLSREDAKSIAIYGLILGTMNLCFYKSISKIPLGIAIAIEFLGPLTLAMITSRKAIDFLWIGFAVLGLGLLLPIQPNTPPLDPEGLIYVSIAAVLWALYIIFGQRAGKAHVGQVTSYGLIAASLVALPIGIHRAGAMLLEPRFFGYGVLVAILSSAIPYSLEMYALKRMPKKTFGILCSMEPAVGALSAMAILHEMLTPFQWIAISSIIIASIGSSFTNAKEADALAKADPLAPT